MKKLLASLFLLFAVTACDDNSGRLTELPPLPQQSASMHSQQPGAAAPSGADALFGNNYSTDYIYAPIVGQSSASQMYLYQGDSTKSAANYLEDRLRQLSGKNVFSSPDVSGQIIIPTADGSTVDGDRTTAGDDKIWWYPDTNRPGGALKRSVSIMKQHLAKLQTTGSVSKVAIAWVQGENSAWVIGEGANRAELSQRFTNATLSIFNYMKQELGAGTEFYLMLTPLVVQEAALNGGLDAGRVKKLHEGGLIVQQLQQQMAASRPDVHIAVNPNDLRSAYATGNPKYRTDKWHLAPDAYVAIGNRFAEAIARDL